MKILKKILGTEKKPKYTDVQVVETDVRERTGVEPIYVKSFELNSISDVQTISHELREGNIVIVKLTPLLNKDPDELREAVEQLKGICQTIGGDLARLDPEKIIATPRLCIIQVKESS